MIQTPFFEGRVNRMKRINQRVNVPLGIGAGNADCCGDCAGAADWSGGGAVVRLRTILAGLGAGGAAAVLPSSSGAASESAAAAAGAGAGAAACLPLDFAPRFDFGSSAGGGTAAAACAFGSSTC